VVSKLEEHGVEKVVPDDATLEKAWRRAHHARRVNRLIENVEDGDPGDVEAGDTPSVPEDLADRVRAAFDGDDTQSRDEAVWDLAAEHDQA
jgi:hypothetical protein